MRKGHHGQLTVWQLVLLALGTCVGGSFFLGTAIPLRESGLAVLLAFAAGGFLVYLVLRALSEMTVARPVHGSFREYAEVAFGPGVGFVVGWVYWTGLVLALSSEATAAALFARLWLPHIPLWILSLGIILVVTALNLLETGAFTAVESVMSGVKLLAIPAFTLLMFGLVIGLLPGRPPVGLGALRGEPALPGGPGALAGSMLIVLFTYAGFEVMGLAAPDAQEPRRTVPRAVSLTVLLLVALYISAIAILLPILPVSALTPEISPMVMALRSSGFPALAGWFNFIIMSASLSTMLAAMYGLGRMLYSLAEEGQAPPFLRRLTPAGAPRRALVASGAAMLVGVVLAYALPRQVYLFLVSSAGFAFLFAYLSILASQLVIRRREGCQPGLCQMPGFPTLTWVGIVLLVGSIAGMPLVRGQGAGLAAGLGLVGLFSLLYWLRRARTPEPAPGASDDLLVR